MRHTPEQIRKDSGLLWREVWAEVGQAPYWRKGGVARPLVRELKKRDLVNCARCGGHWLVEVALLEAMRRAGPLQTHLEDFVGSPQQPAPGAN